MIVRIVRMHFHPENIPAFLQVFEESKHHIRQFTGNQHLALHRDLSDPNVYYTYSHWQGPENLEQYRKSQLFGQVWPATKALFAAPAQAFSLVPEQLIELDQ
jgi:quinol monooxygenase YgiN